MATPIDPFSNFLPVRIRFGDGVVNELAGILEDAGARRPFILLDPVLDGLPALMPALDAVAQQSDEIIGHPLEPGEPTFETIDAAADALASSGANAVVAIGGGSALDTAKGARLVANQAGPFARFVGGGVPIDRPTLPLVTIPTTSGTGSEVTGGIVAIDPSRHAKFGVAGPNNRAQHALVDPVLTHELPDRPTLYGGADALAQAISPVAAITRTPIGDGIGLEGTRLAARALPAVVADPSDAGARSEMACASLLAGLAMNISEAGSEHSLGHALGALHHLPHGLTIGLMLAESIEHDRRFVPETFERVADALGEPAGGPADGSRAVRGVRRILAAVDFPTLRSTGVTEDDLPALADAALAGWIPVSPGPWTRDDVLAAYGRALAIESRG